MADIKIENNQGEVTNITGIPDYALDSTLKDLIKAMSAIEGLSADTKKALDGLGTATKAANDKRTSSEKDQEKVMNDQLNALKQVNKTIEDTAADDAKTNNIFVQSLKDSGSIMKKVFHGAVSMASNALYNLVSTSYSTGQVLVDLNKQGILFNQTLDGMTSSEAIAGITSLGMNASSAASILGNYSQVVATLGVRSIMDISKAFGDSSNMGADFGMTMKELTEMMGEEIEVRQMLGMINTLDQSKTAASAKKLLESQIQYSQVLGKSLDDLKDASKGTFDNAMVQTAFAAFDEAKISTEGFANAMRDSQSKMLAMGFDQGVIDQIGNEMFDITAFMSGEGQDLFAAFSTIGSAGNQVTSSLSDINNALQKNDIAGAQAEIEKLPDLMRKSMTSMGEDEIKSFRAVAQAIGGKFGESLMKSLNQVRLFEETLEKMTENLGDTNIDALRKKFDKLAIGAVAFDQAQASITGSIDTMRMSFTGLMSGPMKILSDIFASFSSVLVDKSDEINDAITGLVEKFGFTADAQGSFAESVKNKFLPRMEDFIDKIIKFIKEIDVQDIKDVVGTAMTVASGLASIATLVYDGLSAIASFFGSWIPDDSMFDNIFFRGAELVTKAFVAIMGVQLAKNLLKLAMGGMGGGAAGAAGSGGGMAKVAGSGLGRIGAGVKVFGSALAKFPGAAIIGAGKLGLAIAAIAAGLAGSGWLLGKGLGWMAEGFVKFNDVDGMNLLKVGGGLIALSAGMLAFGAGAVVGAIGNIIGGGFDKLNDLMGGTSIFEKLADFGKLDINTEGVKNNAEALTAFGLAMGAFGGGTILSGIGTLVSGVVEFFGGKTPFEKMEEFGNMQFNIEGIKNNASAFSSFAEALNIASKADFNALDDIGDIMDDVTDGLTEFSNPKGIDNIILQNNAEGLKSYASALNDLGKVRPDRIMNLALAIEKLHEVLKNTQRGEMFKAVESTFSSAIDASVAFFNGSSESPSKDAMATASTDSDSDSSAGKQLPSIIAQLDPQSVADMLKVLKSIDSKTIA